jgi:RNA polymerase sigma-70 factor (ECF subfamily)
MHLSSPVLHKLRERDPDALTAIVAAHSRRLYRTARALGFDQADAEDLTQDVFVTFLATLDKFEGRSSVSTWLIGILYRKAQERRRVASRTVPHDPADAVFESWFDTSGKWKQHPAPPDERLGSREAAAGIAACLSALPAQQREVFQLRQVDELPAAEASNVLGLSITHIGVLLHRARTRLRECLGNKGWQVNR